MKPVPIEVRLVSVSVSETVPSVTSPRTWTTAARARSARSAKADAEIAGLCRGALVHSAGSRSAAATDTAIPEVRTTTATTRSILRRIGEAYVIE